MRKPTWPLLLIASAAFAQTNAPVELTPILVEGTPISKYRAEAVSTATFTDASPEELPQTVDVLTADFIDEMNPADLHDLLRYIPGIYTGGKSVLDASAGTYTLRGKGGSEPTLDGTLPLAGPMGIFMDPSAFERIEVVKGPVGSTLGGQTGGSSGAGGSVNLVLKQPRTDADYMNVLSRTTFGSGAQRYHLGLDVNERIGDGRVSIRLPGAIETGQTFWLPSSYAWRESYFLAPSLLWQTRDDLRFGLTLTLQYTDQPGYQGIPMYKGEPLQPYDWDSDLSTKRMRDIYFGRTVQSYAEWDATPVWTLRTGFGAALADVAFEHMGAAAFAVTTPGQPFYGQVNPLLEKPYDHQEGDMEHRRYNLYQRAVATFETGPASHQLVLQGDASEKVSRGRSYFAATADQFEDSQLATRKYTHSESDKAGLLMQDVLSWEDFRLLTGCRYDWHENDSDDTGDAASPRIGLSCLPTPWLVFFGNASLTAAPNLGYLADEDRYLSSTWRATQVEAGARVSPVETLWLSLSLYRIRQENLPILQEGSTLYYEAEGKNEAQGAEISLAGNLAANWSAFIAYAFTEYEDLSRTASVRSFDRYPPHALTLATSYRLDEGPLADIVFGLGYRYRQKSLHTMRGAYIGENFYSDTSHVFDCSADIPLHKFGGPENIFLSLGIKNIFDTEYIESNRHYYQCFPGDPRTFEVALQAKF